MASDELTAADHMQSVSPTRGNELHGKQLPAVKAPGSRPSIATASASHGTARGASELDPARILICPRAQPARTTRYRAKIDSISPQSRRHSFESEPECFLGVSLENRNFEPPRFQALLEWVCRRYRRCKILVGDSIHRLTLQARTSLPADQALHNALMLGQKFIHENDAIVAQYRALSQIEFTTCAEIQSSDCYATHHSSISAYFQDSPAFRASVEGFGVRYHRHDWDSLSPSDRELRLRMSSDYFLEEFAIFACLVERGVKVMVYPGSFSTLAEIADCRFPGVSKELESLCVASLHFKKR